ncbi:uncharacterized protein N7496_007515 [Penicillium cataractarum]|uniref:Extracellular protein n=1 Tax=Penicillium cataractarum TaxID=2100454 RepID=A0A9W9V756_9EURO|nr:uncharacterized protein N7496_007515 [Penicillium cataractarum]KAJ5371423.1 hypothetical protein N7496_007515 [Penicillium cataractarum]
MKGIAILAGLLATGASAHMQMMKPYPIRSPLNKDSDEKKDYSYTNPLNPSGADYPCKGYANDPFQSQASYAPGQTYELELDGSATHSGGSCQLALTYDRGKTFKVIESMLGECPISKKYDFQIPSDAPTGEALLAWTWFNKVGNREMYMNCAMVTIGGSSSSGNKTQSSTSNGKNSHGKKVIDGKTDAEEMKNMNHPPMEHTTERRDTTDTTVMMGQSKTTAFNSLPALFVANVAQTGGCVTIEGEAVDFPEPGSNVLGKIDGSGKGYKCTGKAPFLPSDSTSSTSSTSSGSNTGTSSSTSSTSTPTSSSNSTSSANSSNSGPTKNNSSASSSNKADGKADNKPATTATSTATTLAQAMSMIASAFGTPSADPRVLGSQSNQAASTNNAFSSYVVQWTCTSGEILCSPDGYSWAMCSNQRPIFMGNVAPGMICHLGQMVASGW